MPVVEPIGGLPVTMMNGVTYDIRTGIVSEKDLNDSAKDKLYWRANVYVGGVKLFQTKTYHRSEESAHQEGLEWARAHSRKKS